jgi:nitroreductase
VVKNPRRRNGSKCCPPAAACQNLLIAATALGFGAQWITEWGYSEGVRAALKLADNKRVAGFVNVGTAKEKPEEPGQPALADIAQPWRA